MIDKIPKLPTIPEHLEIVASAKSLVPFIGAGVSKLNGYPNWNEFADEALKFFVTNGKINYAQFDQISKLSPRVKLSLAVNLEEQHNLRIDFKKILYPKSDKRDGKNDIYRYILQLFQFSDFFVTTNYDTELDEQPLPSPHQITENNISSTTFVESTTPIYKPNDIGLNSMKENNVIHIHGSVSDPDSMVLTTSDYLELYYGHQVDGPQLSENEFLTFLKNLFKSWNVLFIGYGSDELEILEYAVEKGINKQPQNNRDHNRHYILQGYYSHQLELAKSMKTYFQSLGISLLPFSLDELGWDSLIGVIKHLNDSLTPGIQLESIERRRMTNLLPPE